MSRGLPSRTRWYLGLLCGLVPLLLGGFLASALANRLAFAGWGLLAAAAWAAALRWAFLTAAPRPLCHGVLAAVLAAALGLLALLLVRHGEELRLGLAAVLPLAGAP